MFHTVRLEVQKEANKTRLSHDITRNTDKTMVRSKEAKRTKDINDWWSGFSWLGIRGKRQETDDKWRSGSTGRSVDRYRRTVERLTPLISWQWHVSECAHAFRQVQGLVQELQIVLEVHDEISDRWLLYRAFFAPAWPISADPTLSPMLCQRCVALRVSGRFSSRWRGPDRGSQW